MKTDISILGAARTPIGSFQGSLKSVAAPELGALAIRAAVDRASVAAANVTDVFMGQVLSAGCGQAPARQAAIGAGLPVGARCSTLNKVCGSGLEAVIQAARALQSGEAALAVAGGMENMSLAPHLIPQARSGWRLGHQKLVDSLIHDGLWDPYQDMHMGQCAEACAARYNISREEQDAYATRSFDRANAAQSEGAFVEELVAVEMTTRKRERSRVEADEGPAKVVYDKVPQLRPAFKQEGTITAANASTLNDGAAALVMATHENASQHGLMPLARIVAWGAYAAEPRWFTTAPVAAAQQALSRAGWQTEEVDLWEINEAFAVVPLVFMRKMNLSADRVNVRGGAIALGHPIGASGARIVVSLIHTLRATRRRRGVAAICIGGGEGLALAIELP